MSQPSMEFTLDEGQQAVVDLAGEVFADLSSDERVVASEGCGEPYDERLWGQVLETGLLEAVLPEEAGGAGLGMTGLALVLREQGRHLGRIPLIATGVAALALAAHDGPAGVLGGITSGTARVAAVLPEPLSRIDGIPTGSGWALTGHVEVGYQAAAATHLLVVFAAGGTEYVGLVETGRAGVELEEFGGLSRNRHAAITFTDVALAPEEVIGKDAAPGEVAQWVRLRLLCGVAAVQAGVCAEATRRTAEYTSQREQFGRPLSTNQGVALRAADAYIDTEALTLTVLEAVWRLDHDLPAEEAALTASWWAREAGFRVVHAAQHLHGGMGADVDNHIHRFFLWARELDVLWGSAPQTLEELGAVVAASAAG